MPKVSIGVIAHDLISVAANTSVAQAAKVMAEKDIGSIIVTRNNGPVGIVTEKDIVRKVVAKELSPLTTSIEQVMSSPLITIDVQADLMTATKKMAENNIRRLLVTKKGQIVGIVSQRDVTRELAISDFYYARARAKIMDILGEDEAQYKKKIQTEPGKQ